MFESEFPEFGVIVKCTVTGDLYQPEQFEGATLQLKLMSPPAAVAPAGTRATKSAVARMAGASLRISLEPQVEVAHRQPVQAQARDREDRKRKSYKPQIRMVAPADPR